MHVLFCLAPDRNQNNWVFFCKFWYKIIWFGTKSCDLVQNLCTFSVWEGSRLERRQQVQKQPLRSGWGQNEMTKLSTLEKICTCTCPISNQDPPVSMTCGVFQLFCGTFGSKYFTASCFLDHTTINQRKRWKNQDLLHKPCINPGHGRSTHEANNSWLLSVFSSFHSKYKPVPNIGIPTQHCLFFQPNWTIAHCVFFIPHQTHWPISYPETSEFSHPRVFLARSWLVDRV